MVWFSASVQRASVPHASYRLSADAELIFAGLRALLDLLMTGSSGGLTRGDQEACAELVAWWRPPIWTWLREGLPAANQIALQILEDWAAWLR
jgi:hypothetical protein